MPSSKKLRPLADVIGERVALDDTTDAVVQRYDDLIGLLARHRDEAAALGTEKYLRARYKLNDLNDAAQDARSSAPLSPFELARQKAAARASREVGSALLRRRYLADLANRICAAVPASSATHTERQELLVEALRHHAVMLHVTALVDHRDLAVVADEEARRVTALVAKWWPEVGQRMMKHLDKVAAVLVATRHGRPRKGEVKGTRTAAELLADLLGALGLGSIATHKRARRLARSKTRHVRTF